MLSQGLVVGFIDGLIVAAYGDSAQTMGPGTTPGLSFDLAW